MALGEAEGMAAGEAADDPEGEAAASEGEVETSAAEGAR